MKKLDKENIYFWNREYFVNIKLDYSALIAEYDGETLKFFARNKKPIDLDGFAINNRYAILKSGIDILKVNKHEIFTEPGVYHFEYKNPNMVYKTDSRESGVYFSYFTDFDGIIRKSPVKSEVLIDIPKETFIDIYPQESILKIPEIQKEEGIVIHFLNTNESYKVRFPIYEKVDSIRRRTDVFSKPLRNHIKKAFNDSLTKDSMIESIKILFDDNHLDEVKSSIFNLSCDFFNEEMTKLDSTFWNHDPNKLSYFKLMKFYYYNGYELMQCSDSLKSYDKHFHGLQYELLSFIYITFINLIEKELNENK